MTHLLLPKVTRRRSEESKKPTKILISFKMCLERPMKEEEQKRFRRISWNTAPAVGAVNGEGRLLFSDSEPSDPISGDRKNEEKKSFSWKTLDAASAVGAVNGEGRLLFSDAEPSDPISRDRKEEDQKSSFSSKAWNIALGVGAVAGMAVVAFGVGLLLFSGAGPSDPFSGDGEEENGDMKAPGREYKIRRRDFENPVYRKIYFKRLREEKKAMRRFA